VFSSAGCGNCRTLAVAGSTGKVGTVLEGKRLAAALVVDRVTHGKAAMPPFASRLSAQQIEAVAAYVFQSAKKL
jgi:cytochrome c6